jgi:hypothetical protein
VNVALVGSPQGMLDQCESFRGHPSRFELLAAAAEEFAGWPALLEILLGAAAPGSWGGPKVLWPLWVDEAMHRTRCMIHLTSRLERQMVQRGNGVTTWSASCLGKARALAGSLAELRITDDREVLPCSGILGEIASGVLHLFRLPDRDPDARIVLDDVALAAYQRRALILATTALVMQTVINAMDRGCAPVIGVKLAAQGSGQWRLSVTDDEGCAGCGGRDCDAIVDGLSDLLEARNVRRFHRASEFVTEIDFPGHQVGQLGLRKISQVDLAAAWTYA